MRGEDTDEVTRFEDKFYSKVFWLPAQDLFNSEKAKVLFCEQIGDSAFK